MEALLGVSMAVSGIYEPIEIYMKCGLYVLKCIFKKEVPQFSSDSQKDAGPHKH